MRESPVCTDVGPPSPQAAEIERTLAWLKAQITYYRHILPPHVELAGEVRNWAHLRPEVMAALSPRSAEYRTLVDLLPINSIYDA